MRSLHVYLNRTRVGILFEGNGLWSFEYDKAWASAASGFDLAPGLPRAPLLHADGGTNRPVQWYFDNLLPEEKLRETVSKEAGLEGDDAFALLAYLGAESTGSLVLLRPEQAAPETGDLQPLSDAVLSQRIRDLSRESLSKEAPKRMSVAGAQNKLLVVYRNGQLFEPVGAEPSTHILKPDHISDDYPASVINEYITMRLAEKLGLQPPKVYRRYVPQPVYIVERFDRYIDDAGFTQRRHIIDACQLLNKPRSFKNSAATLDTLVECIVQCRNRAGARLQLFRWLVFNVLVANDDNHLKNISFHVGPDGIDLCPPYDLLSTGTYHTRAFADQRATWPSIPMMIPLPGVSTFGEINRSALLESSVALGLTRRIGERELHRMVDAMPNALAELVQRIQVENEKLPEQARPYSGGEMRLLRTMQHLVIPEMLALAVNRSHG
ncbi:MAG: HipA domain-containing protein [Rhodoferax sp.]|nr:HipA domain-containing protein [Rhodoferax sp.]